MGYVTKHSQKENVKHRKIEDFVRTTNDNGETSLHCAAKMQKSNLHFPEEDRMIIKLLMENGSNVFLQTKEVRLNILVYSDFRHFHTSLPF